MDTQVAIEIVPVVDGKRRYYRTIVFDLELNDSEHPTKVVRDTIYQSHSLLLAVEVLHGYLKEGTIRS